ncbi:hypothetical protein GGC64_002136 [Mycobacterium sp. OAS707]|nr:hypothetical protein [Mycobacterium sp. OAS707]
MVFHFDHADGGGLSIAPQRDEHSAMWKPIIS